MTIFPCFMLKYNNKWKIRPPIGGDMMDKFPLIALLDNNIDTVNPGPNGKNLCENSFLMRLLIVLK
jgi:hypothetical protein